MSLGGYLAGVAGVIVVIASMAVVAVRLRAALLPGWSRSPARLAEIVLAIGTLTVLLQVLGILSVLAGLPLLAACVMAAVAALRFLDRPAPAAAAAPPAPQADPALTALALSVALVVAGRWAMGLEYSWEHGMNHFDTLWYHAPFAARFAQEGSINALHFTDPLYLNWFYPQNSELQHSAGLLLFGRDLLSPLINMGWLGLTLLAAWCIGRPYGMGPAAVIAVSPVLVTYMMVPREPGNAATDIAPIALLLASAAVLLNSSVDGRFSRGALVVAGLATGLAVGTKLTVAATAAALTVGVALLSRAGDRVRSVGIWVAAMAATGGFWFVRNLVHAGNPIPWLTDLGPLGLPGPDRALQGRDPFSVSHYILHPSGIDSDQFTEQLRNSLGVVWPLLLGLAVLGMGLAVARSRGGTVRLLGVAAIVSAIAYLFTPLTASGPEGTAAGFGVNLRYAAPAMALGLALLTIDRWAAAESRRAAVTVGLVPVFVLVLLTVDDGGGLGGASAGAMVAVAVALVAAPVAIALLGDRHRTGAAVAVAVLIILIAVAGWFKQDDYFDDRYDQGVGYGVGPALRVADDLRDQRIGLSGSAAAFFQYGFYGRDLSNHVQYVGRNGPHGDFVSYDDCADWRRAVNAGHYDYLVTAGDLDLNYPARTSRSVESRWTEDPAADVVVQDGQTSVFELHGDLDPAGCPPPPVIAP
jgi:hypothetical protein